MNEIVNEVQKGVPLEVCSSVTVLEKSFSCSMSQKLQLQVRVYCTMRTWLETSDT